VKVDGRRVSLVRGSGQLTVLVPSGEHTVVLLPR
jgi:hypothetical protein